jgi:lipid-A-disaccharide synthase
MKQRIFISTGEVSGDLQGSLLVTALLRQAAVMGMEIEILALGGDRMAAAGAQLLGHTSAIGSMGLLESLPFVLPTLKVQRIAKDYLKDNPPDVVVLIDYMGPNLALCKYLPQHLPKVPVVYYIAPQEWVWGDQWQWGVRLFRADLVVATDRILAIFPKEADYYRHKGGNVTWVGHPLIDRLQAAPSRDIARAQLGIPADQPAVALLPASRRQELRYLMPSIFGAAQRIQAEVPNVHFWIPLALEQYRPAISLSIKKFGLRATIVSDADCPDPAALTVLAAADLAITKSGTVNLEIALLNVPQVVLYKMNPVTGWILKHLLKFNVPFISLPNLVEMQPIVPELVQGEATPTALAQEAIDLLTNRDRRRIMLEGYASMRKALGPIGVCNRAAQEILDLAIAKPGSGAAAIAPTQ